MKVKDVDNIHYAGCRLNGNRLLKSKYQIIRIAVITHKNSNDLKF